MMKPENRKILLFTAFSLIFACGAAGQAKNVGATFSLNGLAASYEHFIESESFIELSLKAECGDMFFGLSSYPGVSASITWNMIFARKESCNGNEIRMFAGPGMLVGWGIISKRCKQGIQGILSASRICCLIRRKRYLR